MLKISFRAVSVGIFVLLVLSACTTVPEQNAFGNVSDTVMERVGKRVHWYQGGPEDVQVKENIETMLATPLNPNKAVQIALLNNRRLQAVYEELGIAQANLVQAGLLKNPIFHGAVKYATSGGGDPEIDLGLVQDFMNIFTLPLRRQVAESEFEATKLRVTLAVLALANDVLTACYHLLAAEQTLELMKEVQKGITASLDVARQLHKAGNITDLELYNEQILFHETRLELASSELAVLDAREQLNSLMGLWGYDTQWEFAERLPEVPKKAHDSANIEKRALSNSIDLAIARADIEIAARRAGLVNATRHFSEFELGVTGERTDDEWEVGPSVGFVIPLFDQGQARQAALNSDLRRLQEEYTALAIEIRAAARRASLNLQLARDRALYLRSVVMPLRERIVNETLLNYNAMQLGVFELLQAQRQQILSARQYLDALRDFWLARSQFEQLLNGRLPNISTDAIVTNITAGAGMVGGIAGGH